MTLSRQQQLLERLQHGPVIIGDGAMGSQLYQRGAPLDAVFEYLNLLQPEMVSQVHIDYASAGAQLLETNTFRANPLRLDSYGLAGRCRAINLAGARLARQAAPDSWIAGSVGPLDQAPDGTTLTVETKQAAFLEQMTALAEGGVDCFMLETFGQTEELLLALEVARQVGLPAIAQLAFAEGGFTGDGLSAEEAARRLSEQSPAAIGANCGAGPRELLQVLKTLSTVTACPLSAFPNSGFPQYIEGRHIYLATPEYFAELGQEMAVTGASLIGGCCGTTPQHIAALASSLTDYRPGQRLASQPERAVRSAPAEPAQPARHFLDDWGQRPLITVELPTPRGLDISTTLARAQTLAEAGADAINLAENPLGRIRMGNLALASRIQQEVGIEVIAHVTGRDRNLLGLHSELMGAHLLGLRTLLAVTGDPVAVAGETGATNVFDVNSVGLLKLLTALNQGTNLYGADLGGRCAFLTGAAFNPNGADLTGQLTKLVKKKAAGARFIQTQPIYDLDLLERLADAVADMDLPIFIGIMPLVSERNALFLHNEVPGIQLPETALTRMRGLSGDEGVRAGMEIAGELLERARNLGFNGYYLMPPFGKVELATKMMRLIRAN